jgi:hypothetical protein
MLEKIHILTGSNPQMTLMSRHLYRCRVYKDSPNRVINEEMAVDPPSLYIFRYAALATTYDMIRILPRRYATKHHNIMFSLKC